MSTLFCSACQAVYAAGDSFCEFCGQPLYVGQHASPATASGGVAVVCLILQNGVRIKLNDEAHWVGRADPASKWYPQVDLSPHDGLAGGVSRRHASLTWVDGTLYVEDSSSNGTLLNGARLVPGQRVPLQSGDELMFGRIYARVKIND